MPEGDSVYQLSKRLQFMRGRDVLATSLRVPSVALEKFDGQRVSRVWPYGKHLFMQFSGGKVLHTHLKMEGTWSVHLQGEKWRKPGHKARVVLVLDDSPAPIEIVGFDLGLVEVFPIQQYSDRMGYLGPDVLYPDWDSYGRGEALRRILEPPQPTHRIRTIRPEKPGRSGQRIPGRNLLPRRSPPRNPRRSSGRAPHPRHHQADHVGKPQLAHPRDHRRQTRRGKQLRLRQARAPLSTLWHTNS